MDKKYDVITIGSIPLLYSHSKPNNIPKGLQVYNIVDQNHTYHLNTLIFDEQNFVISKFPIAMSTVVKNDEVRFTLSYMTIKEYGKWWGDKQVSAFVFGNERVIKNLDRAIMMWEWLAENPTAEKIDYFESIGQKVNLPTNLCYLCDFVQSLPVNQWNEYSTCQYLCPLHWNSNDVFDKGCENDLSPYCKWRHTRDPELRALYASSIVDCLQNAKTKITAFKRK